MINKGSFVRIEKTLLTPRQRAENLPEDTKKVPYEMRMKGFLLGGGELFDEVEITTTTNRREKGVLKEINPGYSHSFGNYVPELVTLREIIKSDVDG